MLTVFINLPLIARVALVALLSIAIARFVNWAIYSWAYYSRKLGPWAAAPANGTRTWLDHLPVVGWYRLRRESPEQGRLYWLRPLLIEFIFPVLITFYYCGYVSGSVPLGFTIRGMAPGLLEVLHWQFIGHFVLFALMSVATFIDFDEQSIPDYVTVPGTVIGLLGAALAPGWLPLHNVAGISELHVGTPRAWPVWLELQEGLWIALAIVCVWGFALLDRRWIGRRGVVKGVQYFFARMFRQRGLWMSVMVVTSLMLLGVWLAWSNLNPGRWQFLFSSLAGLAFAGGVTWGVRLAASAGLGVEALGFGDVTLMAMIGTYIGWQPSLLVFFIAPMVAMLFVLVRAILTGETATPYGPYLCAATVLVLVFWDALWTNWAAAAFSLGPIIVGITSAGVILMGVLLWIWRLIKQALGIGYR